MAQQEIVHTEITVEGKILLVGYHENPHADELLGMELIETFGTAPFVHQYIRDGVILVGIGNGDFDDHKVRRDGDAASSAMLVARALGVEKHPMVAALIKHVHGIDSRGGDTPFGLCNLIKEMGKAELPNDEIVSWARLGFRAKIGELGAKKVFDLQHIAMLVSVGLGDEIGFKWMAQGLAIKNTQRREFFVQAKDDFDATAKVSTINGPKGDLKLVVTESDSSEISKFARSPHGANATIVINRRPSTGNVSIMFDNRARLDLGDICAALKVEEQSLRGKIHERNWDALRAPGTIDPLWDVWHFVHGAMMLNGSHTAKGVSPTMIPLDQIVKMVIAILDPKQFFKGNQASCQTGFCVGQGCPWYPIGVRRCLTLRRNSDGGNADL